MTRRKPGDLAASYRLTVEQPSLDKLHIKAELVGTERPVFAQWWVQPAVMRGKYIVSARDSYAPVSEHTTYEAACTRAHRNARTWLHSALGTGAKSPRRLP